MRGLCITYHGFILSYYLVFIFQFIYFLKFLGSLVLGDRCFTEQVKWYFTSQPLLGPQEPERLEGM